ncbi:MULTISPECIES: hypothetical protein [Vibrio]|nr:MULTISPECIES: hypothetical protein [Vibrio]MDW1746601.1 hypothetical protein [Vibrio sp. Vb2531]MDW1765211.1 hypothetical protein [Vibrio sp. Vb2135]MDW1889755.1 hypothetical protein [Vibrio sp. Vb1574]MDW2024182.1 hypothetical protein [Vibrio sp. 397]MDW2029341.1 hypothetical protein [Vibrio sp. 399]
MSNSKATKVSNKKVTAPGSLKSFKRFSTVSFFAFMVFIFMTGGMEGFNEYGELISLIYGLSAGVSVVCFYSAIDNLCVFLTEKD